MTEKTHYRKAFDSPYLSSADIVEPIVLTIKSVSLEKDRTKKTPDLFNTAHFAEKEIRPGEKLKPMILNATNSKTMKSITGSAFLEDWQGVRVTVFVDHNVKFGKESVEGLRISKAPERVASPDLLEAADTAAKAGVKAFTAFWQGISQDERGLLKNKLEGLKKKAKEADEKPKSEEAPDANVVEA